MGKGDIKSRRGKLFNGSYGVRRPRHKRKAITTAPVIAEVPQEPVETKKPKKAAKK